MAITVYQTKSGTWRADVRVMRRGKTARDAGTFDTKREAQAWAEETEQLIKDRLTTGRIAPTGVTLAQALEVWRNDLSLYIEQETSRRPHDAVVLQLEKRFIKEKSRAKLWSSHPLGAVPLRDIGQLDIEAYIDDRRDDGTSDSTINNDLALLNNLYKHAAAASRPDLPAGWQWQINNPVEAAKKSRALKQSNKRDRRLAPAEIDALAELFGRLRSAQLEARASGSKELIRLETPGCLTLEVAPHDSLLYIQSAFLAAIECALRREKMFEMRWRWVNMSTPWQEHILIPAQNLGPANKGAPSHLPMSPKLTAILKDLAGDMPRIGKALDEPVFGCLKADRAYRLLKQACDALGIEDFRWHDLRHEACSRLAERGWTLPEIQAVSGHKTLQSLERYLHINKLSIHNKFKLEALAAEHARPPLHPVKKIA